MRKRDAYHANRLPGLPTGGEYLEAADVFGRYAFTHRDAILRRLEAADALEIAAKNLQVQYDHFGAVITGEEELGRCAEAYKKAKGE